MATLTIEVPPEVERRLQEEAARRNLAVPEVAQLVLKTVLTNGIGHLFAGPPQLRLSEEEQLAAIDAAYGGLEGVGYSVEDFLREKREDAEWEEARDRGRPER